MRPAGLCLHPPASKRPDDSLVKTIRVAAWVIDRLLWIAVILALVYLAGAGYALAESLSKAESSVRELLGLLRAE